MNGSINTNFRTPGARVAGGNRFIKAGGLNAHMMADGRTVRMSAIRRDGITCTAAFAELNREGIEDLMRFLHVVKSAL